MRVPHNWESRWEECQRIAERVSSDCGSSTGGSRICIHARQLMKDFWHSNLPSNPQRPPDDLQRRKTHKLKGDMLQREDVREVFCKCGRLQSEVRLFLPPLLFASLGKQMPNTQALSLKDEPQNQRKIIILRYYRGVRKKYRKQTLVEN